MENKEKLFSEFVIMCNALDQKHSTRRGVIPIEITFGERRNVKGELNGEGYRWHSIFRAPSGENLYQYLHANRN